MKKILLSVTALLLAVVLFAPKIIGGMGKSVIDEQLQALQKMPTYQAQWQSYESGWFQSSGIINLQLQLPPTPQSQLPEQLHLRFALEMQHGPWLGENGLGLLSWQSKMLLSEEILQQLVLVQEGDVVSGEGHIDLSGNIQGVSTVSAFSFSLPQENGTIEFLGLSANMDYQSGVMAMQAATPGIEFSGGPSDQRLVISDVAFSGNSVVDIFNFDWLQPMPGEADFSIAKIEVQGANSALINDLKLTATSELASDESTMNVRVGYAIANMEAEGVVLRDAGMDMVINNYSVEFSKRYTQAMMELSQANPQLPADEVFAALQKDLLELLQHDLELRFENIRLTLNEGTIASDLSFQLSAVDALPEPLVDPAFWLQNVEVNMAASANEKMALNLMSQFVMRQVRESQQGQVNEAQLAQIASNQAPVLLDTFYQQGFLLNQNDQYSIDFALKNGEAMLNGNAIPLPF